MRFDSADAGGAAKEVTRLGNFQSLLAQTFGKMPAIAEGLCVDAEQAVVGRVAEEQAANPGDYAIQVEQVGQPEQWRRRYGNLNEREHASGAKHAGHALREPFLLRAIKRLQSERRDDGVGARWVGLPGENVFQKGLDAERPMFAGSPDHFRGDVERGHPG